MPIYILILELIQNAGKGIPVIELSKYPRGGLTFKSPHGYYDPGVCAIHQSLAGDIGKPGHREDSG